MVRSCTIGLLGRLVDISILAEVIAGISQIKLKLGSLPSAPPVSLLSACNGTSCHNELIFAVENKELLGLENILAVPLKPLLPVNPNTRLDSNIKNNNRNSLTTRNHSSKANVERKYMTLQYLIDFHSNQLNRMF